MKTAIGHTHLNKPAASNVTYLRPLLPPGVKDLR